jgi:catechol 2,3-dioxygenase-like lactoylglutathione lyase family enzyme
MKIIFFTVGFTIILSHLFSEAICQAPLRPRFNHVFLYVSNLDSSLQFYESAFDLKVVNRFTELEITQGDSTFKRNLKIAFLKFANQDFVLELAERPGTIDITNQSGLFQHVGVEVKDILTAFKKVADAGGKILLQIRRVRTNSGLEIKQAFFTGPDEEEIELIQVVSGGY